jgi:hypothetical protein
MATTIKDLLPIIRDKLVASTESTVVNKDEFWSDTELFRDAAAGIRDLWRDIVDLKQEHYLTIDSSNVSLPANSSALIGVPTDVHKVYMIEPRTLSTSGANYSLAFVPRDYNSIEFQNARSRAATEATNDTICYAVTQQGAPVGAPVILVAPQVTSAVLLSFCYVPTLGQLTINSVIPIPGEADNAVVAWTVAFARGKEREDRAPDPAWLSIYSTEKNHLLQSLGLRQLQEPTYSEAVFEAYW